MLYKSVFRFAAVAIAGLVMAGASHAGSVSFNFDSPVTTGPTQAAGTWYTDRYAPAGFQTTSFGGGNVLKHTIASADGSDNRPTSFSSTFYNTQGRKYDLDAGTYQMNIDLYVDSAWATTGRRMAGLWGTAVDGANTITHYPIIEFASDGSGPRFQVWDGNAGWIEIGLPTGFTYDTWYTLGIELVGTDFVVTVGDLSQSVDANGSTSIANVILQGHNNAAGVDYDIYWDNFETTVVPLPAAAWAGVMLLGGTGLVRRRRLAS